MEQQSRFKRREEEVGSSSSSQVVDWLRQPLQRLKPNVILYVRPEIKTIIVDVLTSVGREETIVSFRSGCFDYLLDFQAGGVSRRAFHALLAREVRVLDPTLVGRECNFYINGSIIRFGSPEYNLVTGLRFGTSSFDPTSSIQIPSRRIFHRLFRGKRTLIDDVLTKFENKRLGNHPPDYVKVANILMLYYVVFCFDAGKCAVDDWVWALVEDEEKWNTFSWGAYSFQILMHYICCSPRARSDMRGKSKDGTYHISGPAWAFQVWMVEAIPQIARYVVLREGNLDRPRCLKWKSNVTTSADFATLFYGRLVVSSMFPDPNEVRMSYFYSYMAGHDCLGVRYIPPRKGSKKKLAHLASQIIQTSMTCVATVDSVVAPSQSDVLRRSTRRVSLPTDLNSPLDGGRAEPNDRKTVPQVIDKHRQSKRPRQKSLS